MKRFTALATLFFALNLNIAFADPSDPAWVYMNDQALTGWVYRANLTEMLAYCEEATQGPLAERAVPAFKTMGIDPTGKQIDACLNFAWVLRDASADEIRGILTLHSMMVDGDDWTKRVNATTWYITNTKHIAPLRFLGFVGDPGVRAEKAPAELREFYQAAFARDTDKLREILRVNARNAFMQKVVKSK